LAMQAKRSSIRGLNPAWKVTDQVSRIGITS
jgi:hypothetical protein